jgi:hypothetical protein
VKKRRGAGYSARLIRARSLPPPFDLRPRRRGAASAEQTKQCFQSSTLSRAATFLNSRGSSPAFDPLNLSSNLGGGPRRGGDRTYQREREKEEYVAASKFPRAQTDIYVSSVVRGGEEDLNFKFYLIIFEFNFVTCPEGGSRPRRQSSRDCLVRVYVRVYVPTHARRYFVRVRDATRVCPAASVYITSSSAQWVVSFYYTPRRKTSGIFFGRLDRCGPSKSG